MIVPMGKLFLIPNLITEEGFGLPANIGPVISHVRTFFVEEPKSARRLLKHLSVDFPLQECKYFDLNEHTKPEQIREYAALLKDKDAGIISESGVPCVADPGADLVLLAHKSNIEIVPLVGPSSILLALMASGLGGQNFAFNGYLPKDGPARTIKIKALENRAIHEQQTQIFMETPYRNDVILEDLIEHCDKRTQLCIALDITGPDQFIKTKTVGEWKKTPCPLPKKPALFIISK
jgi:16S rRNA (cytidine1402-2'-O)-methyltransferase